MTDTTPTPEATPDAAERPNRRKVREGTVVSTKMEKTVVVAVVDRVRHRRYQKTLQRTTKLYAHDEVNNLREGDRVRLAARDRARVAGLLPFHADSTFAL